MRKVRPGSIDVQVELQFLSNTGLPATVNATTPNLVISAWRVGDLGITFFDDVTSPPLSNLAELNSAHTPGGILEIQDGKHRFDPTDALFAVGSPRLVMTGRATDIVMIPLEIELDAEGVIAEGVAQAGSGTSITLTANESSTNGVFFGGTVEIIAGTGAGQTPRVITNYNGSNKEATIEPNWVITPDATSVYRIYATPPNAGIEGDVLDALTTADIANNTSVSDVETNLEAILTPIKDRTDNLPSTPQRGVALPNFEFVMDVTGLSPDGAISIDGAAPVSLTNSVIEVGSRIYAVDLTAAEMNGAILTLVFTDIGSDDRFITIFTKP